MSAQEGQEAVDWAEEWSRTDTESRYEQRGRSCIFCFAPAASPYEWPTEHAEDCPRRVVGRVVTSPNLSRETERREPVPDADVVAMLGEVYLAVHDEVVFSVPQARAFASRVLAAADEADAQ